MITGTHKAWVCLTAAAAIFSAALLACSDGGMPRFEGSARADSAGTAHTVPAR